MIHADGKFFDDSEGFEHISSALFWSTETNEERGTYTRFATAECVYDALSSNCQNIISETGRVVVKVDKTEYSIRDGSVVKTGRESFIKPIPVHGRPFWNLVVPYLDELKIRYVKEGGK